MIASPFLFSDGDVIPIFVEKLGPQIRFFDDGGLLLHLMGRGVSLNDHRKTRFIKNLAEPNGVTLNEAGELEIWSNLVHAPKAFASYISTMVALSKWEIDHSGVSTDLSYLLQEVELYLRAWKPSAIITEHPEFTGISGQTYKLDFSLDGDGVIAITTHHSAISTAAKKLLDIRAASEHRDLKIIVVIDDRDDADLAKREGKILGSVGNVMLLSRLQAQAQYSTSTN